MESKHPQIVVLDAGFAGLTFCQTFDRYAARVTLLDRRNHHLFQPLLSQVATAGLSAPEIAQPIRSMLFRPAKRHRAARPDHLQKRRAHHHRPCGRNQTSKGLFHRLNSGLNQNEHSH